MFSLSLLVAGLRLASGPALADDHLTPCGDCHQDEVPTAAFESSAHQDLDCTACHVVDKAAAETPAADAEACVATFEKPDCEKCHESEAAQYATSVHNSARLPVACETCHQDIHTIQVHDGDKLATAATCSNCHERQDAYFDSVHYASLVEGGRDAPTCSDCHGLHDVQKIDNDAQGREFHTRACLKCHDDPLMMRRNEVTTVAGETYFESFHGKNVRLGFPEQVAGCADCHTSHGILPPDDPKSSVHPDNRSATCQQCHPDAGAGFAEYIPHADDHDADRFPALYWTRLAMTGLLVGTFLFFWIHSVLWALRSFVERERKAAAGHAPAPAAARPTTYRRFTKTQIAMHLVVIVSFLTLSLTGLPLKFSDTEWGKMVMDVLGGTSRARGIHHAAAVVTFGYFFTAIGMSLHYLFTSRTAGSTLLQRLFGPDSLFPNLRDLRDLRAMFAWFFFRGPKPTFERWTYWEKFDFLAVFWGMFAIGGSGLMLWFPQLFSAYLPGWLFNIATIVHSDEALLATGFIFTVHFFNTHFRPEKFPMDTVIFNGRVSAEEMAEERGDQLRRYQAEGRLADFVDDSPPNLVWEFVYRLIGLTAVVVGLTLSVFMFTSLLA